MTSKYSNWSYNISSFLPNCGLSPDTIQLYSNFMVIVALLGVIPLATQFLKVYRTKESKGISIYAFMFSMFISTLWIIYAFITKNGILIISSSLSFTAAFLLVYFSKKYQKPQ